MIRKAILALTFATAGTLLVALPAAGAQAAVRGTPSAVSSSSPIDSAPPPGACTPSSGVFCSTASPQVVGQSGPNCEPFSNGMFWQDATDGAGAPISWTYANGSTPCVKVTFTTEDTNDACDFWLYVPDGDATATFSFAWIGAGGITNTSEAVNEDSVSGWSLITMVNPMVRAVGGVSQMSFTDGNGQQFPDQLGWGRGSGWGIQQRCG